jgi:hypothetical protein
MTEPQPRRGGKMQSTARAVGPRMPKRAKPRRGEKTARTDGAKMQRCKDCAPLLNFLRPGFNAQGWSGWRLLPAHSSWMSCHSRQSPAPSQAPEAEPESRKPKARSLKSELRRTYSFGATYSFGFADPSPKKNCSICFTMTS